MEKTIKEEILVDTFKRRVILIASKSELRITVDRTPLYDESNPRAKEYNHVILSIDEATKLKHFLNELLSNNKDVGL